MSTVTPLNSIPGLDSSTSQRTGHSLAQAGLIKGELLKATVLETLPGNRILFDFYGTRFVTDAKTPLSVGQQLQFQAFHSQPQTQQSPEALSRPSNWLPKATVLESLPDNRYVLDFNGTKVIARFKVPLTIGQFIQLQIVGPHQREKQPTPQEAPLVKGQILNATVVEALSKNKYLLDINGHRIEALSPAAMTPGQQLQLQISATSPQIQLTILSDFFSTLAGKPLVLLGNNIDISTLLGTIKQAQSTAPLPLSPASLDTLETFLPGDLRSLLLSDQGGDFLQKIFNRLGINLENLLSHGRGEASAHTLKATLLEILHQYEGAEKITEQAGRLLATIELYQFAQLQLNNQNILLFPLPLPFLQQGYLLIENYREEGGTTGLDENTGLHYFVHLTMSELGNMKIEFFHNMDDLYLKFYTESRMVADFLQEQKESLQEMVTSPLSSVTFIDKVESPAAELVKMLLPQDASLLNTTA